MRVNLCLQRLKPGLLFINLAYIFQSNQFVNAIIHFFKTGIQHANLIFSARQLLTIFPICFPLRIMAHNSGQMFNRLCCPAYNIIKNNRFKQNQHQHKKAVTNKLRGYPSHHSFFLNCFYHCPFSVFRYIPNHNIVFSVYFKVTPWMIPAHPIQYFHTAFQLYMDSILPIPINEFPLIIQYQQIFILFTKLSP